MVHGHCQKHQENFKSKNCISSAKRRMANWLTGVCPCPYASSRAGVVVPAPRSQDAKVKLFLVPGARHH